MPSSDVLDAFSSSLVSSIPPASVTVAVTLVLCLIKVPLIDSYIALVFSSTVTVNPFRAVQVPSLPFVAITVASSVAPSGVYLIVIVFASVSKEFGVILISFLVSLWVTVGASCFWFLISSLAGIFIRLPSFPVFNLYEPSSFFWYTGFPWSHSSSTSLGLIMLTFTSLSNSIKARLFITPDPSGSLYTPSTVFATLIALSIAFLSSLFSSSPASF